MITSDEKLKLRCKVGDRLRVRVIEQVDATSWIVSLDGTLIQVSNSTHRLFKEGEYVTVRVDSLTPPKLTLL